MLFLSCVCVSVSGVLFFRCVCVCVCDLFIFLHQAEYLVRLSLYRSISILIPVSISVDTPKYEEALEYLSNRKYLA